MIILDTNVISEPLKKNPELKVIEWLDEQDPSQLYITAITVAEMEYCLWALPASNRRTALHEAIGKMTEVEFRGRVLSFDAMSALRYGSHMAEAKAKGKAVGELDGMIAGIAISNDCQVATRDVSPFRAMQVDVINPWN